VTGGTGSRSIWTVLTAPPQEEYSPSSGQPTGAGADTLPPGL